MSVMSGSPDISIWTNTKGTALHSHLRCQKRPEGKGAMEAMNIAVEGDTLPLKSSPSVIYERLCLGDWGRLAL